MKMLFSPSVCLCTLSSRVLLRDLWITIVSHRVGARVFEALMGDLF